MPSDVTRRAGLGRPQHVEQHRHERIGWLRAAVLGANDGIVSTASLLIGVAAAGGTSAAIVTAGVAGLTAGAGSMAIGEYVSVSSQRDAERADIARETEELASEPEHELAELTAIYEARGLSPELAAQVAEELTAHDAVGAHLRDELGLAEHNMARPVQAAVVSAASFAIGAAAPLGVAAVVAGAASAATVVVTLAVVALVLLAVLGAAGAKLGGAPILRAAVRVTVGSGIAMAVTALIGRLVGAAV